MKTELKNEIYRMNRECSNCKHQKKLMKHPWNKRVGKGTCSEQMGWICTVQFSDGSNSNQAIFFDKENGLCELHEFKL